MNGEAVHILHQSDLVALEKNSGPSSRHPVSAAFRICLGTASGKIYRDKLFAEQTGSPSEAAQVHSIPACGGTIRHGRYLWHECY